MGHCLTRCKRTKFLPPPTRRATTGILGGVRIGFLEPDGACISKLQDIEQSCHPVYPGPTTPAQRTPPGLPCTPNKIESARTLRTRVRQQQSIAGAVQETGI